MPTSTRCWRRSPAIARDVRPDLIIHSGDLFDFLPPGALGPCPVPARAQRPVRGGAGPGGGGQPRLARAAGGPGFRGDGVRRQRPGRRRAPAEVRRPGPASPRRRDPGLSRTGGEQRIRLAALPFIHQNRFLDDFASPASGTRDYARRLRDSPGRAVARAARRLPAGPRHPGLRRSPVRPGRRAVPDRAARRYRATRT